MPIARRTALETNVQGGPAFLSQIHVERCPRLGTMVLACWLSTRASSGR